MNPRRFDPETERPCGEWRDQTALLCNAVEGHEGVHTTWVYDKINGWAVGTSWPRQEKKT